MLGNARLVIKCQRRPKRWILRVDCLSLCLIIPVCLRLDPLHQYLRNELVLTHCYPDFPGSFGASSNQNFVWSTQVQVQRPQSHLDVRAPEAAAIGANFFRIPPTTRLAYAIRGEHSLSYQIVFWKLWWWHIFESLGMPHHRWTSDSVNVSNRQLTYGERHDRIFLASYVVRACAALPRTPQATGYSSVWFPRLGPSTRPIYHAVKATIRLPPPYQWRRLRSRAMTRLRPIETVLRTGVNRRISTCG